MEVYFCQPTKYFLFSLNSDILRDPYECQAELGGIARIVKVSFVSTFKFVRYEWEGGGGGIIECQAEFGDIFQRSLRNVSFF